MAPVLFALIVKSPMPAVPPDTVKSAVPVEASVLPPPSVMAVVPIVRADVLLAWVMPVTLAPTPPLTVVVPVPVPSWSRRLRC